MRAVNLLPEEYRTRRPTGARSGSAYVVIGILAAVLAAAAVYILADNQVKDREQTLVRVQSEAAAAEAEANSLTAFTNFRTVAQTRIDTVRGLAASRIDWERVVRELAHVLPDGVWITSLDATAVAGAASQQQAASAGAGSGRGATLTLSGCAPEHVDVATLLVRLRKMNDATEASLNSSAKGEDDSTGGCGTTDGTANTAFDAVVTFAAAATPAEPDQVPASLGGGP